MSSPNKITFGNNAATSYTLNTNNYGYASGDNIPSSYSAYRAGSTGINGATTTTSYQAYEPQRDVVYGSNQGGYTTGVNYSTVQVGSPVGAKYQPVRDVYHPAPVTKITFGGKNYTETFVPQTRYQTSYVAPATTYVPPVTSYQTYQTIRQPTQIQTYQTQPIREQVRYQQKVQTPVPRVQSNSRVQATVPAPVVQTKTKSKRGGCPAWLWPLLGILALLALIVGLLFGLGVFGGRGKAAAAPTPNGAYTVVDQTVILSKDNKTTPVAPTVNVTTPTVNVTTPTIPTPTVNWTTPTVPTPTVNVTTPTIPTPTVNWTTPTTSVNWTTPTTPVVTPTAPSDDLGIDPVALAPVSNVVSTTSTSSYSYPTGYTTPTNSGWSGSTAYSGSTGTTGTTFPSSSGYDYVEPTTVGLRRNI